MTDTNCYHIVHFQNFFFGNWLTSTEFLTDDKTKKYICSLVPKDLNSFYPLSLNAFKITTMSIMVVNMIPKCYSLFKAIKQYWFSFLTGCVLQTLCCFISVKDTHHTGTAAEPFVFNHLIATTRHGRQQTLCQLLGSILALMWLLCLMLLRTLLRLLRSTSHLYFTASRKGFIHFLLIIRLNWKALKNFLHLSQYHL